MRVWIEGTTDPAVRAAVTAGGGVLVGPAEADVGVVDLRGRGAPVRPGRAPLLAIGDLDQGEAVRDALVAGAQDFVLAPFRPEELALRLRRIARATPEGPPFRAGPVTIDLAGAQLTGPYGVRPLTAIEVRLLGRLREAAGAVVGQDDLLRTVWRYHPDVVSRTVVVTIQRLRAKLEPDPTHPVVLKTVRGGGYQLVSEGPETDPDLVGRDPARRELTARLAEQHVVVLHGPPGVGKSRLARTVLGDRLVVVPLADVTDREGVDRRLVAALGLPGGSKPKEAWLAASHRGAALLFDAAEGCLDAALALVAEGPGAAGPRCVVTSRVAPDGEALPLAPLDLASARALFTRRAPGLPEHDASLDAVLARLGGLPLAIELAAGRARLLGLAGLEVALARGFETLTRAGDDPRSASLFGCIAASFALLDVAARDLLALLVCFSRPPRAVDLCDAARAAMSDPESALAALERASLVRSVADRSGFTRVALLDAVRAAARRDLVGPGHVAAWRQATLDRLLALDAGGSAGSVAATRDEAAPWVPDTLALLAEAPAEADVPVARGALALASTLAMTGDPRELLAVIGGAGARARRAGDLHGAARAALLEGSTLDRLGDDRATAARRAAVTAAEAAGAPDLEAAAWAGLAQALRDQRPEEALEACARCQEAAERAHSRHHAGEGKLVEAQVLVHLGRVEAALAAAESACAAFASAGSWAHEGRALGQLAVVLRRAGRRAEAIAAGRAALVRLEEAREDHNAEIVLGNLGNHLAEDGRPEDATPLLRRALSLAQTRGHRTSAAFYQVNLGSLLAREGLADEALALLLDARLGFRAAGLPRGESHAHLRAGLVRHVAGRPAEARLHHEAALDLADRHGLIEQGAEARLRLCLVAVDEGDAEAATAWWAEAVGRGIPAPLEGLRDDVAAWLRDGPSDHARSRLLARG